MTIRIFYPDHAGAPVVFAAQELSRLLSRLFADAAVHCACENGALAEVKTDARKNAAAKNCADNSALTDDERRAAAQCLTESSMAAQSHTDAIPLRLSADASPSGEDAYAIEISADGGRITGSNDRSVLLAVYRYAFLLGCRFPAPGRRHEVIPTLRGREQLAASCRQKAALRHRGVCIEGANSLENILDFIDWLPKVGYNSFFLQFQLPYTFMARWYHHEFNPLLPPEPFTRETAAVYTRTLEKAMQTRGLLLHEAGHGWTGDVLGLPCADWKPVETPLSPETAPLAACLNGKRALFHGIPMNTNLCYSNETVIERFSDRVVEYCAAHPAVSYVHVWLADEFNNICECERCRGQLPTDQYIRLLNRIDEKLTRAGLSSRIVFLLYQELLWPPVTETLRHPERFLLMFAPISRTFERSYALRDGYAPIPPYRRNRIVLPTSLDENMAFLRAWQQKFDGEGFVYDYPLGRAHYGDFGYVHIARIISQDIRKLGQMGLDGYISCQELRVCFPNAFPNYVMGRMLFDQDATFEELEKEYFSAAYGEGWEEVLSYLTELSGLSSCDYFNGKGERKNDEMAAKMKKLIERVRHAPVRMQNDTTTVGAASSGTVQTGTTQGGAASPVSMQAGTTQGGTASADNTQISTTQGKAASPDNTQTDATQNDAASPAAVQNLFRKYLDYHKNYSLRLGTALQKLAEGKEEEAQECWRQFCRLVREQETAFQENLDVYRVIEVAGKYTGFGMPKSDEVK